MHTLVHQANGGLTTSIHLYHQCKYNREACWGKEKWWKAVNANNTPNRKIFDDAVIDWTSKYYWIRYVQKVAKRRLWSMKYELFLIPRINKKSWIHIINFFCKVQSKTVNSTEARSKKSQEPYKYMHTTRQSNVPVVQFRDTETQTTYAEENKCYRSSCNSDLFCIELLKYIPCLNNINEPCLLDQV